MSRIVPTLLIAVAVLGTTCKAQSPTPSPCASEGQAWGQCMVNAGLGTESEIQACIDCHAAYDDSFVDGATILCADLTDLICTSIQSCSSICGGCVTEMADFEVCYWGDIQAGCFEGCTPSNPSTPSVPPPAPAPAPAPAPTPSSPSPPTSPTAPSSCPSEVDAWVQCMANAGLNTDSERQPCIDCHTAYGDSIVEGMLCADLTDLICTSIQSCSSLCGGCVDEMADVEMCSWGSAQSGCFTGCSGPGPTMPTPPAPAPTTPTPPAPAPTSPTIPAPAPSSPPVSDPTSEPTASGAEQPTRAPTAGAGGGGGGEDQDPCAMEMDDVEACLATELKQSAAADCQTCLSEAMSGSGTSSSRQALSCQDLNQAWCPALSSQCQCGACLREVRAYADCAVDEATRACQLDCSEQGQPNPTTTSSGLAAFSGGGFGFGAAAMLAGTIAWM